MSGEGSFPKSDGDILYSSEANYFHSPILEIDDSTDLDTIDGTTDKEYTLNFTTIKPKYLKINVNGQFKAEHSSGAGASINLKIEIKEQGGTYSTLFDNEMAITGSTTRDTNRSSTYTHELTSDEKTNGVIVKITISGSSGDGSYSFENDQIIFEGI
jgi:hypothetical protein